MTADTDGEEDSGDVALKRRHRHDGRPDSKGRLDHLSPSRTTMAPRRGPHETSPSEPLITRITPPGGGGGGGGDLLLRFSGRRRLYLVSTQRLRHASRFFEMLLGSRRFAEGSAVSDGHALLRKRGWQPGEEVPAEALPRVEIADVGFVAFSADNGTLNGEAGVVEGFLAVLHGGDGVAATATATAAMTAAGAPAAPVAKRPSSALLGLFANWAVMADRFACGPAVTGHLRDQARVHLDDAKTKARGKMIAVKMREERLRQRVLVGWVFGLDEWFTSCSARLVVGGSVQWTAARPEDVVDPERGGLWWYLPDDVETELLYRHERILDTLNSLQMHFVGLYTSRERQCKLGYDSSPQCDSFQLGEMIRFFTRLGTLTMHGALGPGTETDTDTDDAVTQDVEHLIAILRQCPSYQVDRNHTHCGLRTKLIPALDHIQSAVLAEGGLCRPCWADDRANYRWSERQPAGHWGLSRSCRPSGPATGERRCKNGHRATRALFMASTRDWTPTPC